MSCKKSKVDLIRHRHYDKENHVIQVSNRMNICLIVGNLLPQPYVFSVINDHKFLQP